MKDMEMRNIKMVIRRLAVVLPLYFYALLPLHAQYEKMVGIIHASHFLVLGM